MGGFLVGAIAVDVADKERSPLSDDSCRYGASGLFYGTFVTNKKKLKKTT